MVSPVRSPRRTAAPSKKKIETTMLALLAERSATTACPSEVARRLDPEDWRPLMAAVREAAARLRTKGLVDVYQHGQPVDPLNARGPIRLRLRAAAAVDYRKQPELYRIGRGEEGVLTVEPYKSELLLLWRFRTAEFAEESAKALWKKFRAYGKAGDFVGMDMARKFIQMGWTRARRYANHPTGRKYAKGTRSELPRVEDPQKAAAAAVFRGYYERALKDARYRKLRACHESVER